MVLTKHVEVTDLTLSSDLWTVYFEVGNPPHIFKLKRSDARLIEGLRRQLADTSCETIKLPGVNSKTFRIIVWYLLDRVVELTEVQEAQQLLQLADLWVVSKLLEVQSLAPKVLEKWSNEFPSMDGLQFDFLRAASRVYKSETADATFRSFFRYAAIDALASGDWSSKRITDYLRAGGPMAEDLYEVEARLADSRAQKLQEERRRSVDLEAELGALREELRRLQEDGRPGRGEAAREERDPGGDRRNEWHSGNSHRDERHRRADALDERARDERHRGERHGHHHHYRYHRHEYRTTLDKIIDFFRDI